MVLKYLICLAIELDAMNPAKLKKNITINWPKAKLVSLYAFCNDKEFAGNSLEIHWNFSSGVASCSVLPSKFLHWKRLSWIPALLSCRITDLAWNFRPKIRSKLSLAEKKRKPTLDKDSEIKIKRAHKLLQILNFGDGGWHRKALLSHFKKARPFWFDFGFDQKFDESPAKPLSSVGQT